MEKYLYRIGKSNILALVKAKKPGCEGWGNLGDIGVNFRSSGWVRFLVRVWVVIFLGWAGTAAGQNKGMDLINLQFQAVQKSGQATFAQAAQNIEGAIAGYEEAASISRRVLEIWQAMTPKEREPLSPTAATASSTVLNSYLNMAYLFRQIQKYEEAETALNSATPLADASGDPVKKKQCMKEAAEIKWARKSYISAVILYEKVLRDQEPEIVRDSKWDLPENGAASGQEDFMSQMGVMNEAITNWSTYVQLASLYAYLSDQDGALRIYQLPGFIKLRNWLQVRGKFTTTFDDSTPMGMLNWVASLFPSYYHIGKGLVLNRVERYQDALTEFASATALLGNRPFVEAQFALITLKGYTFQKLGKLDESISMYRESVSLSASMSSGIREISESYSRVYLADALLEKNQVEAALEQIALAEGLGKKLQDPRQMWDVLFLKGKALQRQGKLEESLTAFKESIENVEKHRAQLSLERLKRDYMATKTRVYEAIVHVLLQLKRPGEALAYVERAKARAFVDLFGSIDKSKLLKPGKQDKLPQEFKGLELKRRRLEESQDEIDRQLRGIPGAPADKRGLPFIQRISQEMAEYQKSEDQLIEMAGAEFAALTSVKPVDISELKEFLDPNTILAEYFRGPSSDTAYLFVLDQKRLVEKNPLAVELSCRDSQLNLKILGFRKLLESTSEEYSSEIHERSRELYKILVGPFEAMLQGKKRLILVPHGNLSFLPFSVLESAEGKILIDQVSLIQLPSAGTLRFCRKKNPNRKESLFAFAFGDTRTEQLSPLPNTVKEVEAIETNFQPGKVKLIKGGSPGLDDFSEEASKRDIVHLATHGVLHPNLPLESSIMLGVNAVPVKDVMTLDLHASLVTLSACQTGIGKLFEGDEIVGLTRAFMYAGTPSVLSSLWPVSDESTALLMAEFFKNFKGGMDKGEALRNAQISVRSKFPAPYHWASFILTGDWQ